MSLSDWAQTARLVVDNGLGVASFLAFVALVYVTVKSAFVEERENAKHIRAILDVIKTNGDQLMQVTKDQTRIYEQLSRQLDQNMRLLNMLVNRKVVEQWYKDINGGLGDDGELDVALEKKVTAKI
jgi:hypothetical protein